MYALIKLGDVEKYPYSFNQLKQDNPNTSYPKNPSQDFLKQNDVYPVEVTAKPQHDEKTERVVELTPIYSNGIWVTNWSVEPKPPEPEPDYGKKITRLAMRNRFTFTEKVSIETAAETSVPVRVLMKDLDSSSYVDLSRQDVIDGLNFLETEGLLEAGRANEILTTPVKEDEVPQ